MIYYHFQALAGDLKISDELACQMLGLTSEVHSKLKADSELSPHAEKYTEQLSELVALGTSVFNNNQRSFVNWMNTEICFFNYICPLEIAKTFSGIQEIKEELVRIEYGILS